MWEVQGWHSRFIVPLIAMGDTTLAGGRRRSLMGRRPHDHLVVNHGGAFAALILGVGIICDAAWYGFSVSFSSPLASWWAPRPICG